MAKRLPRACKRTLAACGLKRCAKCEEIQALDNFHKMSASSDGKQSRCKTCMVESNAEFRRRRPEYLKEWSEQNPDYLNNWRKTEQGRALTRKHNRTRRARKRDVKENFTAADERFVFERDGYKCVSCGITNDEHLEKYGQRLHLDHIKPLSKGYPLTRENAQLLCRTCNCRKSAK